MSLWTEFILNSYFQPKLAELRRFDNRCTQEDTKKVYEIANLQIIFRELSPCICRFTSVKCCGRKRTFVKVIFLRFCKDYNCIAVYVYIRSNSVPIHWVGKPGVSLVPASIFHRIRDEKTNMIRYNFRPSGFDRTRRVRRSIKQKSSSNPESPPLTFRGSVILVQSDLDISLSFSVIFKRVFTEYKSFKTLTTRLLTCGHNYLTNTLGMW